MSLGQAWNSHQALERTRPVRRSVATALRIRRRCRRGKGALGFGVVVGLGSGGVWLQSDEWDKKGN